MNLPRSCMSYPRTDRGYPPGRGAWSRVDTVGDSSLAPSGRSSRRGQPGSREKVAFRRRWRRRDYGTRAMPETKESESVGTLMARDTKVLVECFVPGPPHSQKPWVSRVIDATMGQPRVTRSCELEVEFATPPDRVPWILPSETRLTSMLKVLLDTLEDTILRDALDPGSSERGGLVAVHARVRLVRSGEEAGTRIILRQANLPE